MDDQLQRVDSNEAWHREAYRKSQDDVMVYNPTDEDFPIDWDGFIHVVPHRNKDIGFGKGKRELKRYIGELYRRRMVDKLINEVGEENGKKRIEELKAKGTNFDNDADGKFKENQQVWNNSTLVPRTDNPDYVEKFSNLVFLGVVREYGLDTAEQDMERVRNLAEPLDKKIENITNRPYVPEEEVQFEQAQEDDLEPILLPTEPVEPLLSKKGK